MKRAIVIIIACALSIWNMHAQNEEVAKSLYEKAISNISSGNYDKVYSLLTQSAELDFAEAQATLGALYYMGSVITEQNYEYARQWFLKAAEHNNAAAQASLGIMYLNGLGGEKDTSKAIKWISKSAGQDNISGLFYLGICYREGLGLEQDYSKAMSLFKKALDQKPYDSIFFEDDRLRSILQEEHDKVVSECELHIGFLHEKGWGTPQDWDKAHYWYKKAAEYGNAQAQTNFGLIYFNGSGSYAKDYQTASIWFLKAAEQGEVQAQRLLGYMYQYALGVSQDYDKAYYWSSLAAEHGEAQAQNNLGILYLNGWGCVKDYNYALYWFHKAVNQDLAIAQNNIGYMYENGLGVTENIDSAYVWYRRAYENGYQQAKMNIKLLQAQIELEKGISVPVVADSCFALVIGNADYKKTQLKNPTNDAQDIVKKLNAQGIETISCYNGKTDEIRKVVAEFCERLKKYDAALFYYSGHGIQKDGVNYIVPVNAENNLEEQCVSISDILTKMDKSGVRKKIIILDACRTYEPIKNGGRGGFVIGLANMEMKGIPLGTFILYAAQTNQTASDGVDRNSPFTSAMLKMLSKHNIGLRELSLNIREEVKQKTNRNQIPSYNDNFDGDEDFFFNVKKE